MAKILSSFEFGRNGTGREKYPFAEWLDGRVWELTYGEDQDFTCKPTTLAMQVRKAAKARGIKVRISVNKEGGVVVVQAVKGEAGQESQGNQEPQTEPRGKGRGKK